MSSWPDTRLVELFGIEIPIVLAPMASSSGPPLVSAVSHAGGLGSLPCAALSIDQARDAFTKIRSQTSLPVSMNFFCHEQPAVDAQQASAWREQLRSYFDEFGVDMDAPPPASPIRSFGADYCALVEELKPAVVSFHFGLPDVSLMARLHATGAKVIASATTVAEARWLEARGCDAIVAQGFEAGGHRGSFLAGTATAQQVGTFALVPQVVDAVNVPVIAAGGVADARGIAAAFALGASGVQIGTAYLSCPESSLPANYREALRHAGDDSTVLTNVFTGRPARGIVTRVVAEIGPLAAQTQPFPLASTTLAPLRAKAESLGSNDFSPFWAGQAAALACVMPAFELTRRLASEALERIGV
jgi:nitronate monooxygenase